MEKIYYVDLTPKQRKYLQKMVRVGTNKAKVISRAHILLTWTSQNQKGVQKLSIINKLCKLPQLPMAA